MNANAYPKSVELKEGLAQLRLISESDAEALALFVGSLNTHDLLFLPRDLTVAKVREAWLRSAESGGMQTVIALQGDAIVGCAAIAVDSHSWSPHVGELRVLVAPALREQGLGRLLIQESFILGISMDLSKLTARMTLDQDAAMEVFQDMGFKPEAMLKEHVEDREGKRHDLVILSHDVAQFEAQLQAYGVSEAFDD